MAIARVRVNTAGSVAATNSLALPLGATATAGNLLVAVWAVDKSATSFSTPSGWTNLGLHVGTSVSIMVCGKVAAGTETSVTGTWTQTAPPSGASGVIAEYSGVDTASPFGPSATNYDTADTDRNTFTLDPAAATADGAALAFFGIDSFSSTGSTTDFRPAATGWTWVATGSDSTNAGTPGSALVENLSITSGQDIAPSFSWTRSDQTDGFIQLINAAPTTPPVPTAVYSTGALASSASRSTSVTTAVGDLLVLSWMHESGTSIPSTPTGGTGLTWTSRLVANPSNAQAAGQVRVWTATATTAETFTCTVANDGGATSNNNTFTVHRFPVGSTYLGGAVTANGGTAPSLAYTTRTANNGLVVAVADWNAVDGTTRTWRSVNGTAATEDLYTRNSVATTVYVGHHNDAGSGGSKTVGLSTPTGQQPAMAVVEVAGPPGVAAGSGTVALTGSGTSVFRGVVVLTGSGTMAVPTADANASISQPGGGGSAVFTGSGVNSGGSGTVALTGSGTLATAGSVAAQVDQTGNGGLTLAATVAASIDLTGGGTLSLTAIIDGSGSVALLGGNGTSLFAILLPPTPVLPVRAVLVGQQEVVAVIRSPQPVTATVRPSEATATVTTS